MKTILFSIVIVALGLVSCDHKVKDTFDGQSHKMNSDSSSMHNDNTMMHENSSHNPNDPMGMDNDSSMTHNDNHMADDHEHLYACPMHTEITGKKKSLCSKCGMELTLPVIEKK